MGSQIKNKTSNVGLKAIADVVFCFDCTMSMDDCIKNVKDNVKSFVANLNTGQGPKIDWRMRAVGYGDLEEGEDIQNDNDFETTVEAFQKQVEDIKMCHGGDVPESTLDAIIVAAKTTKWRKSNKIVVVFTDAPTKCIHSSTIKDFGINTIEDLRNMLANDKIILFLWGPSDDNYESLKAVPRTTITILPDPHSEYKSGSNMAKLLETMGKTVSVTVGSEEL